MTDANPRIEIVPDKRVEKRGQDWLFEVAPNGAVSYLSADARLGWRSLAPAVAIEGSLHRGHLAECRDGPDAMQLTLTWRYPRQTAVETMTIRLLTDPAAMTIDRVVQNIGPHPLKVHEARMLAVDGGGILFDNEPPANLRCLFVGNLEALQQATSPHALTPLPQPGRWFGGGPADTLPALAFCDAARNRFLLEASLQQDVFTHLWQIQAHPDWRTGLSVLADYAAIARDLHNHPFLLPASQQQPLSSLFYQAKTGCQPQALYDDCLAEHTRRSR